MDYQFFKRDSKGQSRVVATASVGVRTDGSAEAEWSGPEAEVMSKWLERDSFIMLELKLGGSPKFDPSLAEHWRKLPEIVSGQRLWVVVVEPSG